MGYDYAMRVNLDKFSIYIKTFALIIPKEKMSFAQTAVFSSNICGGSINKKVESEMVYNYLVLSLNQLAFLLE